MIKYFQNRFALTEKGAKDLRQGIIFSTLLNLVLMLPPTYLFFFLMEYLDNMPMNAPHTLWFYLFRGSSNQRIINVPLSLQQGNVVLWEQEDDMQTR